MLRIGVTGGIGSGKSLVCRLFGMLGVPVYDSDSRAKELMSSDAVLIEGVTLLCGPGCYRDGVLDRAFIAGMVFGDSDKLDKLNKLVHPAVFADFEKWCGDQRAPYVLVESAILYESGLDKNVDKIICVDAPEEVRISRAAARDNTPREAIAARISKQNNTLPPADFIIDNSGARPLWPQVLDIDKILKEFSFSTF